MSYTNFFYTDRIKLNKLYEYYKKKLDDEAQQKIKDFNDHIANQYSRISRLTNFLNIFRVNRTYEVALEVLETLIKYGENINPMNLINGQKAFEYLTQLISKTNMNKEEGFFKYLKRISNYRQFYKNIEHFRTLYKDKIDDEKNTLLDLIKDEIDSILSKQIYYQNDIELLFKFLENKLTNIFPNINKLIKKIRKKDIGYYIIEHMMLNSKNTFDYIIKNYIDLLINDFKTETMCLYRNRYWTKIQLIDYMISTNFPHDYTKALLPHLTQRYPTEYEKKELLKLPKSILCEYIKYICIQQHPGTCSSKRLYPAVEAQPPPV
jgi:hypothetical protein